MNPPQEKRDQLDLDLGRALKTFKLIALAKPLPTPRDDEPSDDET